MAESEGRELRRYDVQADRRERRQFVYVAIAFALLAILGGILFAYFVLRDGPKPPELPPPPPPPVETTPIFEAPSTMAWEEEGRARERVVVRGRSRPQTLDDADIRRGIGRIQGGLDACAREHGAIDGSIVRLDFGVGTDGRVDVCYSRSPHTKTPLGSCVVGVVQRDARFPASVIGRRDISWSVTLHR